jgi:hypothetical protein
VRRFIYIVILLLLSGNINVFGQKREANDLVVLDSIKKSTINSLAPSKAAFYSAIVPGLGQAYNKKYWKIPIIYGALGTGIYSYATNNTKYHRYRDAYISRLSGYSNGDLSNLDNERLIAGQKFYQKNRDLSLLVTVGIYILNIVDANIDAHLIQFNVSENLSVTPQLIEDDLTRNQNLGVGLTFNF